MEELRLIVTIDWNNRTKYKKEKEEATMPLAAK
jgi:hypothetical protein